jgi:hypothetical protein
MEQFGQQLLGTRFYVGTVQYEIIGLKDVKVYLPWPRAYEVRVEFDVETKIVADEAGLPRIIILPLDGR